MSPETTSAPMITGRSATSANRSRGRNRSTIPERARMRPTATGAIHHADSPEFHIAPAAAVITTPATISQNHGRVRNSSGRRWAGRKEPPGPPRGDRSRPDRPTPPHSRPGRTDTSQGPAQSWSIPRSIPVFAGQAPTQVMKRMLLGRRAKMLELSVA